jgi:hypothetical protein
VDRYRRRQWCGRDAGRISSLRANSKEVGHRIGRIERAAGRVVPASVELDRDLCASSASSYGPRIDIDPMSTRLGAGVTTTAHVIGCDSMA